MSSRLRTDRVLAQIRDLPGVSAGSEFDFQTDCCHAGRVTTVVLAELPGRACPIAASLELVGERWSLLIVRELALGNRRFSGIVEKTGAPRDRVAARLKALEEAGAIRRTAYQNTPPRFEYHLTESGRGLIPVLDALTEWGMDHAVDPDDPDRPSFRRAPWRPIERTP
jgi:DNA-binding HxlR family transcriptional regulator